jgi:hypothetical protein
MKAHIPARLSWWTLLPFDSSLVCIVIAACITVLLAQVPIIIGKVLMSGVLLQMATARNVATERIAISGELGQSESIVPASDAWRAENVDYQNAGTNVVARGSLRANAQAFTLSFTPAVSEAGLGWNVMWLCGLRRAPIGWSTQTPPMTEHLSAEQLPFVCKDFQG